MRINRRPIAIMRRSCSDSPPTAGQLDRVFGSDSRRRTADRFQRLAKPGQIVIAIGDAVAAGKSKEAIASTFEAALVP
jgi:hypothetical protein